MINRGTVPRQPNIRSSVPYPKLTLQRMRVTKSNLQHACKVHHSYNTHRFVKLKHISNIMCTPSWFFITHSTVLHGDIAQKGFNPYYLILNSKSFKEYIILVMTMVKEIQVEIMSMSWRLEFSISIRVEGDMFKECMEETTTPPYKLYNH